MEIDTTSFSVIHAQLLALLSQVTILWFPIHLKTVSLLKLPGLIIIKCIICFLLAGWLINNSMISFSGILKGSWTLPLSSDSRVIFAYCHSKINLILSLQIWTYICKLKLNADHWIPIIFTTRGDLNLYICLWESDKLTEAHLKHPTQFFSFLGSRGEAGWGRGGERWTQGVLSKETLSDG